MERERRTRRCCYQQIKGAHPQSIWEWRVVPADQPPMFSRFLHHKNSFPFRYKKYGRTDTSRGGVRAFPNRGGKSRAQAMPRAARRGPSRSMRRRGGGRGAQGAGHGGTEKYPARAVMDQSAGGAQRWATVLTASRGEICWGRGMVPGANGGGGAGGSRGGGAQDQLGSWRRGTGPTEIPPGVELI